MSEPEQRQERSLWFVGVDQADALVREPFTTSQAAHDYRKANPGTRVFKVTRTRRWIGSVSFPPDAWDDGRERE